MKMGIAVDTYFMYLIIITKHHIISNNVRKQVPTIYLNLTTEVFWEKREMIKLILILSEEHPTKISNLLHDLR